MSGPGGVAKQLHHLLLPPQLLRDHAHTRGAGGQYPRFVSLAQFLVGATRLSLLGHIILYFAKFSGLQGRWHSMDNF